MLRNARSHRWLSRLALPALSLGLLLGASVGLAQSDEDAPKKPQAEEKKSDPYAVPEDATPEELLEFIEKTVRNAPRTAAKREQWLQAIVTAADGVVESKKAEDEQQVKAIQWKFSALSAMIQMDYDGAEKKFQAFIDTLKDDKRPAVREIVAKHELSQRLEKLGQLEGKAQAEELDKILAQFKEGEFTVERMQMGRQIARSLERAGQEALAVKVYETLTEQARKSDNEALVKYAAKLEGTVRRLRLPGNEIDIQGETLQGETFNIKDWRGKVVLVDYWATWCGPCIGELPNVKENYEKYHDKGFEIVGISLDEDAEKLEEFLEDREIPWTTLFDRGEQKNQGWEHPLAVQYGINAIPAVILVNQEGKVVSLNARGERLGELLAELLGPAGDDKKDTGDKGNDQ